MCDTIDSAYNIIISFIRIILFCDAQKMSYFDKLKIIEYQSGCPINSYKLGKNNIDLYDENNKKITFDSVILNQSRMELEVLLHNDIESDVNINIPIENSSENKEYDIFNSDNKNNKINKNNDDIINKKAQQQKAIQQKIKQHKIKQSQIRNQSQTKNQNQTENQIQNKDIEKDIEQLKIKINNIKQNLQEKEEQYNKSSKEFNIIDLSIQDINSKKKHNEEKHKEQLEVFKSDKKVFNTLSNQISTGKKEIDDIPEQFKSKFIIFQKMKEDEKYNSLTESEEFNKYIEFENNIPNMNQTNNQTQYDGLLGNNVWFDNLQQRIQNEKKNNNEEHITSEEHDNTIYEQILNNTEEK